MSASVCDRCGKPFSLGFSGCVVNGDRYEHHPRCEPDALQVETEILRMERQARATFPPQAPGGSGSRQEGTDGKSGFLPAEGGTSDPRPDPRTHPEYWTE